MIPENLTDIDALTPYAANFRYDDIVEEDAFDRESARQMVRDLRAWAESEINKTS